jgi:2-dehydropantoate 2-reductase
MKKKILIYGAGPFGTLFSEKLTRAGHDVSLLARGKRLEELKEHGVVTENSSTGEQTVTHVNIVESLKTDDYYDLVIIPMRKNQVIDILPALAANKNIPTYLFMMNNAEGPNRLTEALGKSRVMIGFPLPGGHRKGHVMRMLPVNEKKKWTIPIGEPDGSVTERTCETADILESMSGYRVQIRKDMDDWLKCHAAFVAPAFPPAVYAAGTDLNRYANTRDARVLTIRGIREALRALRAVNVKMTPASVSHMLEWLPEPLLVFYLKKVVKLQVVQVSFGHLEAAPDELKHITDEYFALVRPGAVPTPVLDELYKYYKGEASLLPEGSRDIPLNWKGILWTAAGVLTVCIGAVLLTCRKQSRF